MCLLLLPIAIIPGKELLLFALMSFQLRKLLNFSFYYRSLKFFCIIRFQGELKLTLCTVQHT